MIRLLVLYPRDFNSYSKFSRKISKILINQNAVTMFYEHDSNELIRAYRSENNSIIEAIECNNWQESDITHAIIFDDGEEFNNELRILAEKKIPFRLIKVAITRVINLKVETEYQSLKSTSNYEYIGRGSYWGNPYSMYEEGDAREEVIRKFKYDFDYEKFPNKEKKEVFKLAGKRLGCFCKPNACHGDVLADFLNSWDDGE